MITLYQFPTQYGLPNASPFCMKVETWLRMTGLEYRIRWLADSRKTPKQKLPMIDDGAGAKVSDSGLIIEHLKRTRGVDPDAHLDAQTRAHHLALARLMEEHLYWCVVHMRWVDDANWPKVRDTFFGKLGFPMRLIVPPVARRMVRKQLHGHGMGRHSPAEIAAFGVADLQAVSDALDGQDYFGGAAPATLDAVAYSFVANLLTPPLDGPLRDAATADPRLTAYCGRMRAQVWDGWTPPAR